MGPELRSGATAIPEQQDLQLATGKRTHGLCPGLKAQEGRPSHCPLSGRMPLELASPEAGTRVLKPLMLEPTSMVKSSNTATGCLPSTKT